MMENNLYSKKPKVVITSRMYEEIKMAFAITKAAVSIPKFRKVSCLQKDLKYLDMLMNIRGKEPNLSWPVAMSRVDLISILTNYYPEGKEKFVMEYENTVK